MESQSPCWCNIITCTAVVMIGTCSSPLSSPTAEGLSLFCDRGWLEAEVLQDSLFLEKSRNATVKISTPLSPYLWRKRNKTLSHFPLKTSRSSLFLVAKPCYATTFLCTPLSFLLCRYVNKTLHIKIFVEKKIEKKKMSSANWKLVYSLMNYLQTVFPPCSELQFSGSVPSI